MKKFFATCEFMVHRDSWIIQHGAPVDMWTEEIGPEGSIKELFADIPYIMLAADSSNSGQMEQFDFDAARNVFIADLILSMKSGEFSRPTEDETSQWKAGKADLFSLHIEVAVGKVVPISKVDMPQWLVRRIQDT